MYSLSTLLELRDAQAKQEASIDQLRRAMIAAGLSSEDAAVATGLAAEYAQKAYMNGYERGYDAAGVK